MFFLCRSREWKQKENAILHRFVNRLGKKLFTNAEWGNLRNLRINRGWVFFSGPVQPAGLFFGGQLKGAGGGFFAAAGAADIEVFQVCGQGNFRLLEKLRKRKSAGADEFGFKHGDVSRGKMSLWHGRNAFQRGHDDLFEKLAALLPLAPFLGPFCEPKSVSGLRRHTAHAQPVGVAKTAEFQDAAEHNPLDLKSAPDLGQSGGVQ